MLKNVFAAATILGLQFLTLPASATPFVDVRAIWSAGQSVYYPLPDGLTLSCWGDADDDGVGGCYKTISLDQPVTASGTYTASAIGGVVITNTSGQTINDVATLEVSFSAFNPGGPDVGLGIDNAMTQAASFSSSLSGDTGDTHHCSVGFLGTSGAQFSPTTCGVNSPDGSTTEESKSLIDFLPGAEVVFTFEMFITATFDLADDGGPSGVPEPAGMIMLLGLGMLARRRFKKPTTLPSP